jgi:NIMA (never in mitosis gene a)-related kinase
MSLSTLKDFEMGKILGKGAFGSVQLVKRKLDGIIYAMKSIKMVQLSEKDKENSLNEIRILASLSHKNIIGYKDAFYDEGSKTLNIVMEFADDGDISTKIKYNLRNDLHFRENIIWEYLIQILEGLNYLHEKKIIHRDLKSANIFLMKDNTVKIGDLNVSKINKQGMAYTQTGTPYYASPEIWLDQPYDYKSDIWSLGCILYELCELRPPFRGTSLKNLCINIQKGIYNQIPDYYSNDLKAIINMMLQRDPNNRPTTGQLLGCDIIIRKRNELKIITKYSGGEEKQGLIATIQLPRNLGEINKSLPLNKYNNKRAKEEMLMEDEYETNKRRNGFLDENDKN